MKLCVFDFDSTLMDGETIDFLAEMVGVKAEVAAITERAMLGELDFFEALTARVALLKGLKFAEVLERCQSLPLMPGAKEAIVELQDRAYRVVIFSGGFRAATRYHASVLGVDADFANFLHHQEGVLTGKVGGEMMTGSAKGEMLLRLQRLLGVSPDDTLAVGDGANDLSMFEHAATRVAFCAKPVLREAATHIIDTKDLGALPEMILS